MNDIFVRIFDGKYRIEWIVHGASIPGSLLHRETGDKIAV